MDIDGAEGNLSEYRSGDEVFGMPLAPYGIDARRIYPKCTVVIYWSCNDAFKRTAKGGLSSKMKE